MGDRSRLPKWAQQEMERLENDAKAWKEQVQGAKAGLTDTLLRYRPEPDRGLPMGSTMVFKTLGGEIEARMKDGSLEVRALGGSLVLEPYTSNVVHLSSRPPYGAERG